MGVLTAGSGSRFLNPCVNNSKPGQEPTAGPCSKRNDQGRVPRHQKLRRSQEHRRVTSRSLRGTNSGSEASNKEEASALAPRLTDTLPYHSGFTRLPLKDLFEIRFTMVLKYPSSAHNYDSKCIPELMATQKTQSYPKKRFNGSSPRFRRDLKALAADVLGPGDIKSEQLACLYTIHMYVCIYIYIFIYIRMYICLHKYCTHIYICTHT